MLIVGVKTGCLVGWFVSIGLDPTFFGLGLIVLLEADCLLGCVGLGPTLVGRMVIVGVRTVVSIQLESIGFVWALIAVVKPECCLSVAVAYH